MHIIHLIVGNWVLAFAGAQFIYITRFMSKLLFFTSIVLVLLNSCTSKTIDTNANATNDSIKKYLELAGNDSLNVKLRNKYNDKAFSLVDVSKNDTLTRYYLSKISFNYMNVKNEVFLNKIGKIHLEKSIAANDTLNLARCYRYKAGFLKNKFVYDSSFYFYNKAEKFYKRTNDILGLGVVYLNKGFVQQEVFDYFGAEISFINAYNIFNKIGNKERIFAVYNQLGLIYLDLKDFEKASMYFNNALEYINENDNKSKAIIMSNIGFVLQRQSKYKEAIISYKKTLKVIEDIKKYQLVYSNILDNLIHCKFEIGDYKNSYKLILESLIIRRKINNPSNIYLSLFKLSDYYLYKKQISLAKKYALDGLSVAKKSKNKSDYLDALIQITKIDKSYIPIYYQEYIDLNEKLQEEERKTRNNFFRIQFETDKIIQEKDKAINQKWLIISISGAIILIITLLFIISRQRNKQKELQLLQEQQKANEEVYELMLAQKSKEEAIRKNEKKRIALELHDGVMNKLASTRLNLDVLKYKKDAETIEKCVPHIAEIYTIEQEIRNITHDLTQESIVIGNSFSTLMNDFINTQNSTYPKTHFKLEMEETISWNNIPSSIKMNLFRIVQEATHNINKFAKAKKVVISFVLDEQNICLSITDNGIGFDPEIPSEGIGLKNMKQRVNNLKGKLIIQSIKNKSTSINIAIPLK
jgi:signal transduction histidine kinase